MQHVLDTANSPIAMNRLFEQPERPRLRTTLRRKPAGWRAQGELKVDRGIGARAGDACRTR